MRVLLDELIAAFPACFKPHGTKGLPPFAVGIEADILARKPEIDPSLLQRALRVYTTGPEYFRSLIAGQPRVDLDGKVVQSVITPEEIAQAEKGLAAFQNRAQAHKVAVGDALALIPELVAAFPACFKPHRGANRPPLKVGIKEDIVARRPDLDTPTLFKALALYVSSFEYQRSVLAGVPRVDLDGNVVQTVFTTQEKAHAEHRLAILEEKSRARKEAGREAATNETASTSQPEPEQRTQSNIIPKEAKSPPNSQPARLLAGKEQVDRTPSPPRALAPQSKPTLSDREPPPRMTKRQQALLSMFPSKQSAQDAEARRPPASPPVAAPQRGRPSLNEGRYPKR
ncbi:ProQ/FINO family protein [Methylocystis sp. IM4]|uniref:ProQ/FINO family protein n=1 Tax=Methylocystis sp. IM4 TaxID=3136560 RepID=UPI003119B95F